MTPIVNNDWFNRGLAALGKVVMPAQSFKPNAWADVDHDHHQAYKRRRVTNGTMPIFPQKFPIGPSLSYDSGSVLRVDLNVLHRDLKPISLWPTIPYRESPQSRTRAICRLTIHMCHDGFRRVVEHQVQSCDLFITNVSQDHFEISSVQMLHPFYVLRDHLVTRRRDGTIALADSYFTTIDFEAADSPEWLPLSLRDLGLGSLESSHTWTPEMAFNYRDLGMLRAETTHIVGRQRLPLRLVSSALSTDDQAYNKYHTAYAIGIDLSWLSGTDSNRPLAPYPCQPHMYMNEKPMVANREDQEVIPLTNGEHAKSADIGPSLETKDTKDLGMDDGADEAITPQRALRLRGKPQEYNLKVLSDKQQNKVRKRRSPGKPGHVHYLFLDGDDASLLASHHCPECPKLLESTDALVDHLEEAHDTSFEVEQTTAGIRIKYIQEDDVHTPRKKLSPLKLDKKPRLEATPVTGATPTPKSRTRTVDDIYGSPSPVPDPRSRLLRQSSSRSAQTPRDTSTPPRKTAKKPAPVDTCPSPPKEKPILVPRIRDTPLFHPVSNQVLKAGDELPQPKPDSTWLMQKYRETLREYDDVTASEKEYMMEWKIFIDPLNLTSAVYFTRYWLQFVKHKARWLVAADRRMVEFAKHMASLLGMDRLTKAAVGQAMEYIGQARKQKEKDKMFTHKRRSASEADNGEDMDDTDLPEPTSPRARHVRAGNGGCAICKDLVIGPQRIICSNKVCHDLQLICHQPKTRVLNVF